MASCENVQDDVWTEAFRATIRTIQSGEIVRLRIRHSRFVTVREIPKRIALEVRDVWAEDATNTDGIRDHVDFGCEHVAQFAFDEHWLFPEGTSCTPSSLNQMFFVFQKGPATRNDLEKKILPSRWTLSPEQID